MARSGLCSWPRLLLLLLLVLGDAVAMAMAARPLLGSIAGAPLPGVAGAAGAAAAAEGPTGVARPGGRTPDRSIAGAEVILAGFAAAVMAVIFCYIRVTRKQSNDMAGMAEKA